jgi:hypothetical protein
MAGGLTAALGGSIALAMRSLGSYAAVDALWQRAELAWVRRRATHETDRRTDGGLAWRMSMLASHPTERDLTLAAAVTRRVRESLSTDADLREILEGAATQARRRPLHLLGKAALTAGVAVAVSSEAARGIVTRMREGLSRVFGATVHARTPLRPTAVALASASPNVLRYTASPSPGPDGIERLLRLPVLSEMERHGIALDSLSRLDEARALNATANLAQRLGVHGPLHPGDVVDVPQTMLEAEVDRSLHRPSLPGAASYVDRVAWPRWVSLTRSALVRGSASGAPPPVRPV